MESLTVVEIGSIVAVIVGIIKGIEYLTQPFTKQSKQVEALEKRMGESEKDRQDMHEYMKVNFIALKELLKHNIDGGNNVEGMKMANNEIDKYLSRKI